MGLLHVKVVPNSSRTRIAGRYGDAIKVNVAAPPERGKANGAVIELLAKFLHIKTADIQLVAGHTQARKTFSIPSLAQHRLDALLR